jgi:tetratricopeptide (TPR) repeat protein
MADAKECIDPIADKYLQHSLKIEQGQAWVIMGSYKYMVEEELVESKRYLKKAIGITEETGDVVISAYAQYMLGLVLAFNCDFEKAIHYFEILLNLSEALAFDWRIAVMKSNLSIYGYIYHGMVSEGYKTSRDAVDIAEKSGDIYSKAMAYPSHGVSCYYKGLLEEALPNLKIGVDYTEKINMAAHNALAHQYLGHVYIQQGKFQKARKHYEETIRIREKSLLFPSSANLNRIALARVRCLGGEKFMEFDCIYRYARENRVKIYEGTVARYIGEILLHANEQSISSAEFWIEKAIKANTQNGMRCDLGWDYILYSEFFLKMARLGEARDCINRAIGIFKMCGADGWVKKLEERLSGL